MGYRGQQNRDDDEREEWRRLPLRERYDWRGMAWTVALCVVAVSAIALLSRVLR